MKAAIAIVLGSWLTSSPEPEEPATEAAIVPATEQGLERGLVVRLDPTFPQAEAVRGWIEERGQQVLSERSRPLGEEDLIRVVIEGGPYDYRISLELWRREQALDEQPGTLHCECGSDEMLDEIGAAIDDAADRLARARDAEEAAEAEAAEAETVREPMVDERPASRMGHRKADGAIIGCGLASLVGGAALIGGGAWNFSKVDRQGSSRRAALEQAQLTEAEREDYRSELGDWQEQWRGTATGLVVAGSVLAAAGAGLMTWGLVRTQRGRGAKPRASSAAPVASREQVGVAMVMRF